MLAVLRIRNKSFGSCFGSGSGLKLVSDPDPISDPDSYPGFDVGSVADPNKSFGSCFGSGSGLKLVSDPDPISDPDSNPDPNPGSGSRSETGQIFCCTKIFTQPHLQGCSVTWLRTKCAKNWRSMRILQIYAYCLCIVSLPHAGEHKVHIYYR
jgi:hypothetical protein